MMRRADQGRARLLVTIAGVLMVALVLSGVTAAAGPPADRGPATHIVVFHDGVDADAASQDLALAHGLVREFVYSWALNGASFIVPPGREADIQNDPRVAFIERNQIVRTFAQEFPTGIDRIDAELSSTANIDGVDDRVDVDIAIIDTGIDLDHPDLNVFASINCARGGPFGGGCKDTGNDGNGHGTHVAGTAAALDNGIGVVGVAPGARLWAVRVLDNSGSGWMSWIIGGIDWVTGNADQIDVANMSLGCACDSPALDAAIASSVAAGVVYAVAAGNSAKDSSTFSPANHPDVITVSAIADFDGVGGGLTDQTVVFRDCTETEDDSFACFSNFGADVDIAAPGVRILSTWNDGGYYTISGTSMASPHAAGAAALHIAVNGKPADKAGADAVRDALIAAGTPQSDPDGYTGDPDGYAEPLLNVGDTAPGPQAPRANAGPDVTVSDGDGSGAETVSLDGSGSSDSDGTIVSYAWDIDGDGNANFTEASFSESFAVGSHTVTLTVTDNDGLTGTDEVVVTVNPNQAPATDAGPDQTVGDADGDGSEDVTLDGSASSDADGTIVSYDWDIDGNGTTDATGPNPVVAFVLGVHTVTLRVTDNAGAASSDSVVITITEPSATPTSVSVGSFAYSSAGGRYKDKHVSVTITLVDNLGGSAGGASISVRMDSNSGAYAIGSGITGSDGTITLTWGNAPGDCYTTTVTSVTLGDLTFDPTDSTSAEVCKDKF